ncbi:uncharacterized protein LOC116612103 [Nematostella vectensis]|uniref:uncharacterized protein LOC116612103 n=1 Tax=Nematostella vectensis TaxID=45351 RepID=UPI00139047C7|nr:uncharacterized protein LOC116612103 [Nematostella vectensis]
MDNDSPGPALFTSTPIKSRSIGLHKETSSPPFKRQRMTTVSYGRGEFSTPSDDCIIFDDSFSYCSSPENVSSNASDISNHEFAEEQIHAAQINSGRGKGANERQQYLGRRDR